MDSKDFIKMIKEKVSQAQKKALSVYSYKQRQSRPRVKKNIIQPEDNNQDNNHCVVNDCTYDWGGKQ
tara:strand:+ start:3355 stop:3555 length:201 start_codon:yes stop_codon:yes gene_type:complete